jgi:hypothetical protein
MATTLAIHLVQASSQPAGGGSDTPKSEAMTAVVHITATDISTRFSVKTASLSFRIQEILIE